MGIYARSSFTGSYRLRGSEREADCVIGHEFGWQKQGFGSVNQALAHFIADRYVGLPLFLNSNIAGALQNIDPSAVPDAVFAGGAISLGADKRTGTWGELAQAQQLMSDRELSKPVLVAQAFHVGRAALQAQLLGMDPIIPEGLPRKFDPDSEQWWTQNRIPWTAYEVLAPIYLRYQGKI